MALMDMALADMVLEFLDPKGPLAALLPGFVRREAQEEMAAAVAQALQTPGGRLVVEAGTGTGKSLAYLSAALLSGQQVVVATGTRALQDQLFGIDIPVVLKALKVFNGQEKTAALMKGRNNYLCLARFDLFVREPLFAFAKEARAFPQIEKWAERTQTGDRAEIKNLPDNYATWADLDAGSETCAGQQCSLYEDCFVTKMRRRATKCDLVVVNHHLLCADQRVRLEALRDGTGSKLDNGSSFAQVIPDADALVIDEAHGLAEVATSYFGVSISSGQSERFSRDVRRMLQEIKSTRSSIEAGLIKAERALQGLFAELASQIDRGDRVRLTEAKVSKEARQYAKDAAAALGNLASWLQSAVEEAGDNTVVGGQATALVRRAEDQSEAVAFVLDRALSDKSFVSWVQGRSKGATLGAAPIDVATALNQTLFAVPGAVVLTSATLAVAGKTRAFEHRVGISLPPGIQADSAATGPDNDAGDDEGGDDQYAPLTPADTTHLVLASPFDYPQSACLYAPADMPEPGEPNFETRFDEEVMRLMELSGGGAMLLFTSYYAMNGAFDRLGPELELLGHALFKQGDAPKLELLDAMRQGEREPGPVLFATQSFWEGVDIRGPALRVVVIDRLPFRSPADPIVQARGELAEQRGQHPFVDVSLPEAALALKQGAGRLIRAEGDAGVVAVLDGRLRSRGYGRTFLQSLPPMVRVGSPLALQSFWDRKVIPKLALFDDDLELISLSPGRPPRRPSDVSS